jgi:HK97 family phage major capsid protein
MKTSLIEMRKELGALAEQEPLSNNPNQLRHDKAKLKDSATALVEGAMAANRDLNADEQEKYNATVAKIRRIDARLNSYDARFGTQPSGLTIVGENGAAGSAGTADAAGVHEALAGFMRGDTTTYATDSPLIIGSGGLSATVPTVVMGSLQSYFLNDPFQLAGSTIYNTDDTTPLVKPIISAGAAPDTYAELSTSTDSHPMQVDSFTFGGTKYSRLVKVSMESLMNSALDLPAEITNELSASVANGFTAAISTAMMAALDGNASTFVDSGSSDPYYSLNALLNAVPQRWDSVNNAFMGSRASRLLISNARDTYGRPLFDPVTNSVLGRKYVVNDNLSRVVYGNFGAGCFVRKSPFFLQRLLEAYADSGEQGFRATQFLDSKFLASVSAVTVQPLYFTHLDTAGS